MKIYQLSKKLLNHLAKELNGELYRLCYRKHWNPSSGYEGNYEYVHVHQMDYLCSSKYNDMKLVLKNGEPLYFRLGQQLMILDKYVGPDLFVDWFVNPLPRFSVEN